MASPNTLKLRSAQLYNKNGRPTALRIKLALRELHTREWEKKHGKAVQVKAAREVETGIKDSRSATA